MITFSKKFWGIILLCCTFLLAACNDKSATNNEQKIQGRITIKKSLLSQRLHKLVSRFPLLAETAWKSKV